MGPSRARSPGDRYKSCRNTRLYSMGGGGGGGGGGSRSSQKPACPYGCKGWFSSYEAMERHRFTCPFAPDSFNSEGVALMVEPEVQRPGGADGRH
ncbi:hypothetical protein BOTBODRAFT_34044 [Botryobasidium botryosum FD-172 SS1]|uniref:Uncharacterized protein n=1 Tax=Botryobasidium botryosum (strain FD-172 SS1) TaxID=930990 RepID=A0A067MMV8_BOTB1|nr:hypothetical protein BOTBODRAFT_34044 [Botryobasidium botryosum FD-172 SS1]